jgi:hypothetical protein
VANTPVMNANATAQSTIHYCSYEGGSLAPVYNGTNDVALKIGGGDISTALPSSGTGVINPSGVFDVWAVSVSGVLTIGVATNGSGGGWASDTGGSNTARGTGYSQLDFTTRSFITNKNAITNLYNGSTQLGSIPANQATYLGSFYSTAAGQTAMNFTPAAAVGGGNCILGLYNAYNRVDVVSSSMDSTGSWLYASATWRLAEGSINNRISWVDGLQMSSIRADYSCVIGVGGVAASIGIGINWTSGNPSGMMADAGGTIDVTARATVCSLPLLGFNYVQAIESARSGSSVTYYGSGLTIGQSQALFLALQM